jgi:hypothetical protein
MKARTAVMAEPRPDHPDPDLDPELDRVRADLEQLSELAAAGIEIDGEVQVSESTWVLYGRTSYDGEIVIGEYHDAVEAEAVFRAAPRDPDAEDDEPVP